MAVEQKFIIELPVGDPCELTREEAEQLYIDLREALGYSGWANQKADPPESDESILEPAMYETGMYEGAYEAVRGIPAEPTQTIDVDAIAARMEKQAAAEQATTEATHASGRRGGRNPGSGIGSGPLRP